MGRRRCGHALCLVPRLFVVHRRRLFRGGDSILSVGDAIVVAIPPPSPNAAIPGAPRSSAVRALPAARRRAQEAATGVAAAQPSRPRAGKSGGMVGGGGEAWAAIAAGVGMKAIATPSFHDKSFGSCVACVGIAVESVSCTSLQSRRCPD